MVDIVGEGPGGAACCPTHKMTRSYALQDGQLAEMPSDGAEPVLVTAADLDGTQWALAEINYDEAALDEPFVTLAFEGDTFGGSGGCNSYSGAFALDDGNPFVLTMGPIASTMMACPDPVGSQEAAFYAALNNARQWGYVFGDLAVYYSTDGDEYGRLLFTPAGAAP